MNQNQLSDNILVWRKYAVIELNSNQNSVKYTFTFHTYGLQL